MRPACIIRTISSIWNLGLQNLVRVALYRIGIRTRLHPATWLKARWPDGPFFHTVTDPPQCDGLVASSRWRDEGWLFSHHRFRLGNGVPEWHRNPIESGKASASTECPWYRIRDFDPQVGDIKSIWELSRLEWVVPMAQRAALGSVEEISRLNDWLTSWGRQNPPYKGVNWKCGQEAAIRVMRIALAALILDQVKNPAPALVKFVEIHLRRIRPTIGYALAQNNNHGTSEAAALFIGGTWLATAGYHIGNEWAHVGRRWLEERVERLVEPDGTFSQYSTVYHRLLLDTYSLVEVWRRKLGLQEFPAHVSERLGAAVNWLYQITDLTTGDTPNLGANDGTVLIPLVDKSYRDFRPSLQLAARLFCNANAVPAEGPWDQYLYWLDLDRAARSFSAPGSITMDSGGIHILRSGPAMVLMRYPRFQFRPSHCDALHVDLWLNGNNLLRDGGSYSYAAPEEYIEYFSGVESHNTVQFDGRDQMPRIGRFLYGAWLKSYDVSVVEEQGGAITAGAAYRDCWGAIHKRELCLSDDRLVCRDIMAGKARFAVLRWRLAPGSWRRLENGISGENLVLKLSSNRELQVSLVEGHESRHYLERTPIPVLEVRTCIPATITSEFSFK